MFKNFLKNRASYDYNKIQEYKNMNYNQNLIYNKIFKTIYNLLLYVESGQIGVRLDFAILNFMKQLQHINDMIFVNRNGHNNDGHNNEYDMQFYMKIIKLTLRDIGNIYKKND